MPRSSGTYTAPSGSFNPAVNGAAATATDWTALLADISAALTQSISNDGQTPIVSNIPMSGNKHTGLGAGITAGDSLRFQQLFSQGAETDVASAATVDIGAQLTNFLRITGSTTITSFGTNYNGPRYLRFAGAMTLTNSATLILPFGANITTTAGDIAIAVPVTTPVAGWQVFFQYAVAAAARAALDVPSKAESFLRNMHNGFVMSTAGSSTTITIGAGQCADSTNSVVIDLAASINKTTGAWAVGTGNGGLDTGTIANSTWYYLYAIRRPDTGVVDVLFSTSPTSPAMPTNYTQRRLVFAWRTNSSGQWESMVHYDRTWLIFVTPQSESVASVADTARTLVKPSTAPAIEHVVRVSALGASKAGLITSPQATDSASANGLTSFSSSNNNAAARADVLTNASGQIGLRLITTPAEAVTLVTHAFSFAKLMGVA
jgi:hypothetical protein